MITDFNQLDLSQRYTYKDYLTWHFNEMVELIKGKVVKMSPAPGTSHQSISTELLVLIGTYLKRKPCKVFAAPFDVRLLLPDEKKKEEKIDTIVQPDISVVCDLSKLDAKGCLGAPDWIIEILSPGTSKRYLTEKFDIYQHAGVKEYWVVHPTDGTVIPYKLDEKGDYQLIRNTPFAKGEKVPVEVFPDLIIDLDEVFTWE